MVYSLAYRRPPHVSSSRASLNGSEKPASVGESFRSNSTACHIGIPDALSFDRVISGGTCPPCTTRDFMNYLIYIEHAAENLQFFLWYQDYVKRFSALPASERALSSEWTIEKAEADGNTATNNNAAAKTMSPETAAIFKDTEFAVQTTVKEFKPNTNPFYTPPRTPDGSRSRGRASDAHWDDYASTLKSSQKSDYVHKAAGAFEAADVKYRPCKFCSTSPMPNAVSNDNKVTIQPFREEVTRIVASYISEDGSRQLNLAAKERIAMLRALATTTHPSAFRSVLHTVEWTLRHQAHPNFIRWTICNGNRPRVVFARGLGIGGIVAGLTTAVLITLSGAGRGWRAFSAILFMIGIATLIAAWKGMCVVCFSCAPVHPRSIY